MVRSLYITHPQVVIDPDVPTPRWGLNETGRARAEAFAARNILPSGVAVFSSTEAKASELAAIIAVPIGAAVVHDEAMGENDRSSTGYMQPQRFEATADRFFAHPHESIDGWERAIDAQARIVSAVRGALVGLPAETLAVFCGHGAVGTLLKCHCGHRAIARDEDQRRMADPGGGNAFVFDLDAPALICDWVPMEELDPALL
jgi:broad specificity phosphatase PhoE